MEVSRYEKLYGTVTMWTAGFLNQLNKLEPLAEETEHCELLLELETDIMLALEKFQKGF